MKRKSSQAYVGHLLLSLATLGFGVAGVTASPELAREVKNPAPAAAEFSLPKTTTSSVASSSNLANSVNRSRGGDIFNFTPQDIKWGWLSVGKKEDSFSGAIGYRQRRVGIELGIVDTNEVNPFGLFGGFPPFNTRPIGVFNTSPLTGFDFLIFSGDGSERISFYGGIGMYVQSRSLIGESGGAYFELGGQDITRAALSVGMNFMVTPTIRLGAGYHSERGPNATLSFKFR